jgi:hypothetical protein
MDDTSPCAVITVYAENSISAAAPAAIVIHVPHA